jgi:hypothetical protein
VVGAGVLLRHVQALQLGFEGVAPALAAGQAGGEHHPVVGQVEVGVPWAATAAQKVSRAIGPVTRGQADTCRA